MPDKGFFAFLETTGTVHGTEVAFGFLGEEYGLTLGGASHMAHSS
jgi:hypothetical protein